MQDQWRAVAGIGGGYVFGLDYGACDAGLRRAGIETDPDLWAQVRLIEDGAKQVLNGR